ncbi:MAG: methyltransferase, partial [Thermoleophilia bacterium]|nr:methyltransferase [Thermoleophilia bacterium]
DRVIIAGNVEPTLLQTARTETVWEFTRDAVLEGREAPLGYVLVTGCSVPTSAAPCNLFTMVKAAKQFGQYG